MASPPQSPSPVTPATERSRVPPKAMRTATPRRQRKVLFVTTEIADFVKTGGLGDVSATLPRALRTTQDVRVLIPGYRSLLAQCGPVRKVGWTRGRDGLPACNVGEITREDGLKILVLLHPALYEREGTPYDTGSGQQWSDNAVRFATLSSAAADIASGQAGMRWRPQVVHLNDWPCALTAAWLKWRNSPVPTVLTIHNLAYQGLFPHVLRARLGMPPDPALEFHGRLSFLRAGLAHADYLTTVSPHYAAQITAPADGCGLDSLLRTRAAQGRLFGIVNGIDASWNSRTDPALPSHFAINQWERRAVNAAAVREEFALQPGSGPLFSLVARLVHQKGVDLVCETAHQVVAAGGQIAIIGRGQPHLERRVSELARRFRGQVSAKVGFAEDVARRMFAGSDFLLMPSRFEPCGLSQLYAQTYASLPIAHATGGLVDTVDDGVTGLLFEQATVPSLRPALQRAFRIYGEPRLLNAMRRAAMAQDRSWAGPCARYVALYERMAPLRVEA